MHRADPGKSGLILGIRHRFVIEGIQRPEQGLIRVFVPQHLQTAVVQILPGGFGKVVQLPDDLLELRRIAGIGERQIEMPGDRLVGSQIIDQLGILPDHRPAFFIGLGVIEPFHLLAIGVDVRPLGGDKDLQRRRSDAQIPGKIIDAVSLLQLRLEIEIGGQHLQQLDIPPVGGEDHTAADIGHRHKALRSVRKAAARHGDRRVPAKQQCFQIRSFLDPGFGFSLIHVDPL